MKKTLENEFGFILKEEFKLYKGLCTKRKDSKLVKKKADWNEYVVNKYKDAETEGLTEFFYFLRYRFRNVNIYNQLLRGIALPIVVSVIVSLLLPELVKLYIQLAGIQIANIWVLGLIYLIVVVVCVIATFFIFKMIKSIATEYLDSSLEYDLYNDYMVIISEMIAIKIGSDDSDIELFLNEKEQIRKLLENA